MQEKDFDCNQLKIQLANQEVTAKSREESHQARMSELNMQLVNNMNEVIILENQLVEMHDQSSEILRLREQNARLCQENKMLKQENQP